MVPATNHQRARPIKPAQRQRRRASARGGALAQNSAGALGPNNKLPAGTPEAARTHHTAARARAKQRRRPSNEPPASTRKTPAQRQKRAASAAQYQHRTTDAYAPNGDGAYAHSRQRCARRRQRHGPSTRPPTPTHSTTPTPLGVFDGAHALISTAPMRVSDDANAFRPRATTPTPAHIVDNADVVRIFDSAHDPTRFRRRPRPRAFSTPPPPRAFSTPPRPLAFLTTRTAPVRVFDSAHALHTAAFSTMPTPSHSQRHPRPLAFSTTRMGAVRVFDNTPTLIFSTTPTPNRVFDNAHACARARFRQRPRPPHPRVFDSAPPHPRIFDNAHALAFSTTPKPLRVFDNAHRRRAHFQQRLCAFLTAQLQRRRAFAIRRRRATVSNKRSTPTPDHAGAAPEAALHAQNGDCTPWPQHRTTDAHASTPKHRPSTPMPDHASAVPEVHIHG
ncbi:hypothetical protein PLICRDRAFT_176508 [Plicaturopsis crispa FD-325 SS-3]|nr:hypothetical protein PLICRDRAFT_176508 [Plicaturopsis crispa FD-325 SS-3]